MRRAAQKRNQCQRDGGGGERAELNQNAVIVLQCLSTFYIRDAYSLSTLAFRMVSDYTGLSLSRVSRVLCYLARHGYVALAAATGQAARLDACTWEERSHNCARKRYYAYFVSNAPACLRDEDCLRPVAPGCCYVNIPDKITGCSVTVASNFDGVYNTYTSRDDCCPPPVPEPLEYIFEPKECICEGESAATNLWFLRSAFCPEGAGLVLFRRQLLVLYTTGYKGSCGMDVADYGSCILICMNDQVLQQECATDLIAYRSPPMHERDECLEIFHTLSGIQFMLDPAYGVAHYGGETAGASRLYRERGCTVCGTRIVELSFPGSGRSQPRHDPYCALEPRMPPLSCPSAAPPPSWTDEYNAPLQQQDEEIIVAQ